MLCCAAGELSEDIGTGWTFFPATPEAFMDALGAALAVLVDQPDVWRAIQQAGMARDSSWGRAAAAYEQVFATALESPTYSK